MTLLSEQPLCGCGHYHCYVYEGQLVKQAACTYWNCKCKKLRPVAP